MSGKEPDKGGFPEDIFQQMQAGHELYMRNRELDRAYNPIHDSIRREASSTSTPPGNSDRNIFVTFKDFVDTNLHSLTESFKSLPSNIAELKAKMQEEREARKQEELAVWRRWTGLDESPDHVQMTSDRASAEQREEAASATLMLLREAKERNAHVSPEKIEALYRDSTPPGSLDIFAAPMLSPGGACYYQPDSGYNAPSTAIWRAGTPSHRWLSIDWFKRSPYSPISLEEHPNLADYGSDWWRAAFEDLVNATLDKPMASREQYGQRPNGCPQSTNTGPGLDWMLSLQCRGILPPQLPSLYNTRWPSASRHRPLDLDEVEQHLHDFTCARRPPGRFCAGTIAADIQALADEIATPAPQQDADYRELRQPETEQDLYDVHSLEHWRRQLEMLEQENAERLRQAGCEHVEMERQTTEQKDWQQRLRVQNEILDALFYRDGDSALEYVDEWRRVHGGVRELMRGLEDALSNGKIPTDDIREIAEGWADDTEWRESGLSRLLSACKDKAERREQECEALGLSDGDDEEVDPTDSIFQPVKPAEHAPASKPANAQPTQPHDVQSPRIDVLSSLTTSHTTRLPDGTVTTKVVLKQRFADGREETEEREHTYRETASRQRQTTTEAQTEEKPRKTSGWFWN
ncbi:hypothetical protein LTR85_001544 [Meristemomyces frigidus]|nr:hypothetical protein LTR85_001544 [Meristemomyces frigidus]